MNNGLRQNGQPLTKDKKKTIAQPVIGADQPETGLPLNSVLYSLSNGNHRPLELTYLHTL